MPFLPKKYCFGLPCFGLGIFFVILLGDLARAWNTHGGDQVFRVDVPHLTPPAVFTELLQLCETLRLDVWGARHAKDATHRDDLAVDIMVHTSQRQEFKEFLQTAGLSYKITVENVSDLIKKDYHERTTRRRQKRQQLDVNSSYHKLEEIYRYMVWLQMRFPELFHRVDIGKSLEGETMWVLKIGLKRDSSIKKRSMFIDSGIHAREWITHSSVLFVIKQILDGYEKKNETMLEILKTMDLFFLPVINPDGYKFCHDQELNRMWRKNRRQFDQNCVGVDLNRNFDFHWNETGVSSDPCNNIYAGPAAASEPETRNMMEFLRSQKGELRAYISYHSYSQVLIYPYSYMFDAKPTNIQEQIEIANKTVEAMKLVHNVTYVAGAAKTVLYDFSGSSADWVQANLNVYFAFLIELRDRGEFGFILPEDQILPVGQEVWAGWKVMAQEVLKRVRREEELLSARANIHCMSALLLVVNFLLYLCGSQTVF